VSAVVVVVISFVAAPPRVSAQPPNVYPALVVAEVLASDSVDNRKESDDIRVELSVAGTEVAKVFPSKTIVGLAAVDALADEGITTRLTIAKSPARTTEIGRCDSEMVLEFSAANIQFLSVKNLSYFYRLTIDRRLFERAFNRL
jgi:hypothetical protein